MGQIYPISDDFQNNSSDGFDFRGIFRRNCPKEKAVKNRSIDYNQGSRAWSYAGLSLLKI